MFDELDNERLHIALKIYFWGVMFHGVLMVTSAIGQPHSDTSTLMDMAQKVNIIARCFYYIPGICYTVAAIICFFTPGWKSMVTITVMIAGILPIMLYLAQVGIWFSLAAVIAMIVIPVIFAFFPVYGISLYLLVPGIFIVLFILLTTTLFSFLSSLIKF